MNTTTLTATTDRLCDSCNAPIKAGHRATWNAGDGVIECVECSESTERPSIIVASVARSRGQQADAAVVADVADLTDAATASEAPDGPDDADEVVAAEVQVEVAAEASDGYADEVDDDATPVYGMRRPPAVLDAPDPTTMFAEETAPPLGMPSVPPTGSSEEFSGQIEPLVPPSHEPLVEQTAPDHDPIAPPPPPPPASGLPRALPGTPPVAAQPLALTEAPALSGARASVPGSTANPTPLTSIPTPAPTGAVPTTPSITSPSLPSLPSQGAAPHAAAPSANETQAGSITMRNRRIPRSRTTIERLVIAPSGVWVLDDRDDEGKLVLVSDRRRSTPKLHIGGKDRSKMLRRANVAAQAVLQQLSEIDAAYVPVRRVFCFSNALCIGAANERIVDGVALLSRVEFDAAAAAAGPLDSEMIARLADHLGNSFPAA